MNWCIVFLRTVVMLVTNVITFLFQVVQTFEGQTIAKRSFSYKMQPRCVCQSYFLCFDFHFYPVSVVK